MGGRRGEHDRRVRGCRRGARPHGAGGPPGAGDPATVPGPRGRGGSRGGPRRRCGGDRSDAGGRPDGGGRGGRRPGGVRPHGVLLRRGRGLRRGGLEDPRRGRRRTRRIEASSLARPAADRHDPSRPGRGRSRCCCAQPPGPPASSSRPVRPMRLSPGDSKPEHALDPRVTASSVTAFTGLPDSGNRRCSGPRTRRRRSGVPHSSRPARTRRAARSPRVAHRSPPPHPAPRTTARRRDARPSLSAIPAGPLRDPRRSPAVCPSGTGRTLASG